MEYIKSGRFLTGYDEHEDLRYLIDRLGAKTFMYASDYPHSDTEWQRVPSTKALETISAEEKSAILGENAVRFYNI
jgi:predicted TIM-barrel fold metal-dependent hydrolase